MNKERYKTLQCCNPLKKHQHSVKDKKKLRNVTDWMCIMFPDISKLSKICDKCRKEVSAMKNKQEDSDSDVSEQEDDPGFTAPSSVVLETLNTSLQGLGESPIDSKKIQSKQYSMKKIKNIESAMKRQLFVNAEDFSDSNESNAPEESVLANLKTKFSNANSRKKKLCY